MSDKGAQLILGTGSIPNLLEVSPWLDVRAEPLGEVLAVLAAQQHRRFIKSHLPLDGLPFWPQVKYIVVGRDARDVFMSLWHHHTNCSDALMAAANETPGRVGPPLPGPQRELHAFWRNWITRGWFAWESEGYPYWGNLHHTMTWWPYRTLANIPIVHFNDLLSDLPGEVHRVARFLEIDCSDWWTSRSPETDGGKRCAPQQREQHARSSSVGRSPDIGSPSDADGADRPRPPYRSPLRRRQS
jgi:aryl sulfotransferase